MELPDKVKLRMKMRAFFRSTTETSRYTETSTVVENRTAKSIGFFDSIFSATIEQDFFFKLIVFLLALFGTILLILTFVALFYLKGRNGVKAMFFHIFLCELFYLIIFSFSALNVFLEFRLNQNFCVIANLGEKFFSRFFFPFAFV